jgi:hypothetical protein
LAIRIFLNAGMALSGFNGLWQPPHLRDAATRRKGHMRRPAASSGKKVLA